MALDSSSPSARPTSAASLNSSTSDIPRLSYYERALRVLAVVALGAALFLVAIRTPSASPSSCPLEHWIGIPCLLCGGTRAMQALLHGDWQRCLYFNWLAFPVLGAAVYLIARWLTEAIRGRRLSRLTCNARQAFLLGALLLFLWILHVYDAVSTPKPELLNSQSILSKFLD